MGIIPISYTQDVIGPISRTVEDVATALAVMAGGGFDSTDNAIALVPEISRGFDYAVSLTPVISEASVLAFLMASLIGLTVMKLLQ